MTTVESGHGDNIIAAAEDWLRANYAGPVRIDDLSARVAMSPRHFARRFRAATGDTPLVYLHKQRVGAAQALLASGRGTVQDISMAVGYEDVGFFRKVFRRHTGSTPQAFRRSRP